MRRTSGVLAAVLLASALGAAADTAPYVQVPVVLDAPGANYSHYRTDLTVANFGALASDIELTFLGTSGPSAGPYLLGSTLLSGRQAYISDVIGLLRLLGAPFPTDGSSIIGTLLVRLPSGDATPPFVGARVSTPNTDASVGGSFGTYATGVPVGTASNGVVTLYGLRENAAFRSNVGLVYAGGTTSLRPIQLLVQIYDGPSGHAVGDPIVRTLQPGQWDYLPSVLTAAPGVTQGYVRVSQTSGTDRYIAYAVVNDGGLGGAGTNDGSWIDSDAAEGILPIVLTADPYKTELVLAHPSSGLSSSTVTLGYMGSDQLGEIFGGYAHFDMDLNSQIITYDALQFLRDNGIGIPTTGTQGGILRVTGALAYARVYKPNTGPQGGSFGVAFPAIPSSAHGHTEGWIYGLRQDELVRSNIAVANTAANGSSQVNIQVDLYDGPSGRFVKTLSRFLTGGQWYQWAAPYTNQGVRQGFARVRCTNPAGGTCDFVAYGVVNDGATTLLGTSDGSYIPMVRAQ